MCTISSNKLLFHHFIYVFCSILCSRCQESGHCTETDSSAREPGQGSPALGAGPAQDLSLGHQGDQQSLDGQEERQLSRASGTVFWESGETTRIRARDLAGGLAQRLGVLAAPAGQATYGLIRRLALSSAYPSPWGSGCPAPGPATGWGMGCGGWATLSVLLDSSGFRFSRVKKLGGLGQAACTLVPAVVFISSANGGLARWL